MAKVQLEEGKVYIYVDNTYIKINGLTKEDEQDLWNKLSFEVQSYGQQQTYFRHLYNKKTKMSYTGLLPYVIEFLDDNALFYEIKDFRNKPIPNADFNLVEFIDDAKTIPFNPRPYQLDIINNLGDRGIIQAATGAGKTCMMAQIIAKHNVKPVMIFADKISLCQQIQSEISKFLGVEVGIVGDGIKDYKDITVCSLLSSEEEEIKKAKLALFDECHHIPSNTCMDVANKCENAYYRYGMSATPWRDGGDDLLIEAALSKKGSTMINASTLINLGYLVKPLIMFVPVRETFKGKNYHDIYNKAIVNNETRNKMIYRIVKKMREKNKKILVLIKNIEHGEKIQEALLNMLGEQVNPIVVTNPKTGKDKTIRIKNVEFLSGKDEATRRQAVIEGMKQGMCDVMIASSVADEGLDLPILDTLILAGGGKSSTRAFQRIGRVIRKYEGKEKAIVFDFVDYTPMLRKHSRVRQKLYKTEPEWDISVFNVNPDATD